MLPGDDGAGVASAGSQLLQSLRVRLDVTRRAGLGNRGVRSTHAVFRSGPWGMRRRTAQVKEYAYSKKLD